MSEMKIIPSQMYSAPPTYSLSATHKTGEAKEVEGVDGEEGDVEVSAESDSQPKSVERDAKLKAECKVIEQARKEIDEKGRSLASQLKETEQSRDVLYGKANVEGSIANLEAGIKTDKNRLETLKTVEKLSQDKPKAAKEIASLEITVQTLQVEVQKEKENTPPVINNETQASDNEKSFLDDDAANKEPIESPKAPVASESQVKLGVAQAKLNAAQAKLDAAKESEHALEEQLYEIRTKQSTGHLKGITDLRTVGTECQKQQKAIADKETVLAEARATVGSLGARCVELRDTLKMLENQHRNKDLQLNIVETELHDYKEALKAAGDSHDAINVKEFLKKQLATLSTLENGPSDFSSDEMKEFFASRRTALNSELTTHIAFEELAAGKIAAMEAAARKRIAREAEAAKINEKQAVLSTSEVTNASEDVAVVEKKIVETKDLAESTATQGSWMKKAAKVLGAALAIVAVGVAILKMFGGKGSGGGRGSSGGYSGSVSKG